MDERELISGILAGDNGAFRLFIEQYQGLVSHIVFKALGNGSDREDVCQEVFIKVYRNLENFQFKSKLSTWLARIAYNTALNYLNKKRPELYDDIAPEDVTIDDYRGEGFTPEEISGNGDSHRKLRAEIERLPVQYRTALTLYHLEGMSYNEIGEIMELPEGTVKSHLFRARKILKQRITAKYTIEELCG